MASRLDFRALSAWLAAVALSALGWWFGSGLQPLWWATWLAPLPVLLLATRTRARWAALAAFAAYLLGGFNEWTYARDYIGLPIPVIALVLGMPALTLALGVYIVGSPTAKFWVLGTVVSAEIIMRGVTLIAASFVFRDIDRGILAPTPLRTGAARPIG